MPSDVHFVTYDPDEMWNAGIKAYMEAGGSVLYPGDEKEIHLRGVMYILMLTLAGVDTGIRMNTLQDAVGAYLDLKGDGNNCPRIEESSATAMVRITFQASGKSQTIPAGSILTADGAVFWSLMEDVVQTGYSQETETVIACNTGGNTGNGVPAGTALRFVEGYPAVVKVTTLEESTGGQEREDDETYRERIHQFGLAAITTGPARQYEAIARAVSSEVLDAKAVFDGPSRVKVWTLLKSESGAEALLKKIKEACSPDNKRPLTDFVSAEQGVKLPYIMAIKYKLPEDATASMTQAITDEIDAHLEWQNNTLGRPFNPERLISRIYNAGAVRVVLGEESHFNGGACEYTEIDEGARCDGTVSIEVMA